MTTRRLARLRLRRRRTKLNAGRNSLTSLAYFGDEKKAHNDSGDADNDAGDFVNGGSNAYYNGADVYDNGINVYDDDADVVWLHSDSSE